MPAGENEGEKRGDGVASSSAFGVFFDERGEKVLDVFRVAHRGSRDEMCSPGKDDAEFPLCKSRIEIEHVKPPVSRARGRHACNVPGAKRTRCPSQTGNCPSETETMQDPFSTRPMESSSW
jgi:hypothetical protein